jgi:hypothetical protein
MKEAMTNEHSSIWQIKKQETQRQNPEHYNFCRRHPFRHPGYLPDLVDFPHIAYDER